MKDFERLEALLKTTSFDSLSKEDRNWAEKEIGRTSYIELYQAIHMVKSEKEAKVDKRTKKDLVRLMKSKQRASSRGWIYAKTPLYANFLILLLLIPVIWFLVPPREVIVEKAVEVNVPVYETVLVQLPPDTVLVEKTIRVEVPIYLTRNSEPKPKENSTFKKESFAEQKALHNLLVSGE